MATWRFAMLKITQLDNGAEFQCYGELNTNLNLQGYTKNRTIGGKLKQRWIGRYNTSTVAIVALSEAAYSTLESMFLDRAMLQVKDDSTEVYGVLVGDSLSLTRFEDYEGNVYYQGSLTIES
jgi:hypothetical protein